MVAQACGSSSARISHQSRSGWHGLARKPSQPVTAHVTQRDRDEAAAAGCDGFLAKPCLLEVLSWEIQALLNPPS